MNEINGGFPRRASAVLSAVLLGGATLYVLIYLFIAFNRMTYPYELEWMEGAVVDHVQRVLSGRPVYTEPSIEFVPFIYTPLYYYVSALFAAVLGIGFLPLRLVSTLSSIGCLAVLFHFVRRETGSPSCGILAASLFSATFLLSGAWLDIARMDSLFLFLLLGGVHLLRFARTNMSFFLAGVLTFLSIFTKQTALFVAIPAGIYCLLCLRGRARFIYPSTVLLLFGASAVAMDQVTGGWYTYYVFSVPRQNFVLHDLLGIQRVLQMSRGFWLTEVVRPLPVASSIALVPLIHYLARKRWKDSAFFILLFGGMLGTAWLFRVHIGAYTNVLLPAYAAIAVCFGIGCSLLLPGLSRSPPSEPLLAK